MMPVRGWFKRSAWLETFRPGDGKGHILISDGVSEPEDIEVSEIVCDICNSDAGRDHDDGSEGRIYYDGVDSLCETCGAKSETEYLEEIRRTLMRRGWADFHVANLKPEHLRAIAHEQAVDGLVGTSPDDIAKGLHWDTVEALLFCSRLLEAVNEHRMAKVLFDEVEKRGNQEAGQ